MNSSVTISFRELRIPLILAFLQFIIQTVFHGSYGYFRDELYYIACSKHLAFGYVDEPPFSIGLLWFNRMLFGDSLYALRLLPSVAGAGVVIIAALITKRLGGGTFAQGLASLSVVAAPGLISDGRYFSMNAFDVFFWAAGAYVVVRILSGDNPKLWILFGVLAGIGLMNKYSMGFFCIGLFGGLLFTSHRFHLGTKWFWLGSLAAVIIFLPHIIWEIWYGYPTLEFMRNASEIKNIHLNIIEFLSGQIRDMNYLNAPLWLLGLYYFFFHRDGRYRPLGWMYIVIFIVMIGTNAKVYYLAPVYPLLLASGAVFIEMFIREHEWNWIKPVYSVLIVMMAIISLPFALPVLPVEQFVHYERMLGILPRMEERNAVGSLPQYYADEFGWKKMVAQIDSAYMRLTPQDRSECVIYVRNYGEAAAVDFFGKQYGLPDALCGHNNYWLWGPGNRTGNVSIIIGGSNDSAENFADLRSYFSQVELVAVTYADYAMPFENGRQIFICKGTKYSFQKIWPKERLYI